MIPLPAENYNVDSARYAPINDSFDFLYSDGKSPKSFLQSLTVGIVEVLKQYPLTRDLVHDKILYFYQIQLKLDKNPQNCKNSFCLGPFLTTKSRRYDDYKDSISEIFFRNYAHKQGHMTGWPWAKQLAEQSATHMVEHGRWPLTSEQDNKGQVAEMTKRWSPVTNRLFFCRHWCPCKCPRWWGTHSSLRRERRLPCRSLARFIWAVPISWLPIGTLTRLVRATPIGRWLPIRTLTRCSSELLMYSSKSSDKSQVGSRTRRKICIRHHTYLSTHKQEKPVPKLILKDSRQRHDGSSCDLKSDRGSRNGQCCRDSEPQKWTVVEFGFVT